MRKQTQQCEGGGSHGGGKTRSHSEKGKWRHMGSNFSEVVVKKKKVAETKRWHLRGRRRGGLLTLFFSPSFSFLRATDTKQRSRDGWLNDEMNLLQVQRQSKRQRLKELFWREEWSQVSVMISMNIIHNIRDRGRPLMVQGTLLSESEIFIN